MMVIGAAEASPVRFRLKAPRPVLVTEVIEPMLEIGPLTFTVMFGLTTLTVSAAVSAPPLLTKPLKVVAPFRVRAAAVFELESNFGEPEKIAVLTSVRAVPSP